MKLNQLGNSDIKVSEICLGTMTFGEQNTQSEGFEQMDYALDQGVNFFDTAELYSVPTKAQTQGSTETIIGNWFEQSGKREKVILASKVVGAGIQWIRDGKPITKQAIDAALEQSLTRLKTDYIDLYQLHWPNRGSYHFGQYFNYDASSQGDTQPILDNMFEVLETLNGYKKEGKIREIGLSNETAWGTMQFLKIARENGFPEIVSMQNEYSLLYRRFDAMMGEVAHHENVGLLAYSPLADGLLTGKYQGGHVPIGSRADLLPGLWGRINEKSNNAVDAYMAVAKKFGISLPKLSLAYLLTKPFMTSIIIGATKMDQLKENIEATDIEMTQPMIDAVNQVFKEYPIVY